MHKLTAKRQVTIPQAICSKLGLEPGDYVQVFERDGVAHLVKMCRDDLAGTLSNETGTDNLLTEENLKKAIKNKAARKFRNME